MSGRGTREPRRIRDVDSAARARYPEPALRLARLLRDRQRPEDVVVWYRTALGRSTDAGVEIAATRETDIRLAMQEEEQA